MFYVNYRQISGLSTQVTELNTAVHVLEGTHNSTYQNITIMQNGTSLTELYAMIKDSVVLILGTSGDGTGTVQGSGFAYNFQGRNVILTNNHVVDDTTGLSVTFSNGRGYSATILGTDPYADLAVLSVPDAPASEFKAVTIVNSASLTVGETVIAIGNPYGLVGSMTTGIVSAVGRSITEDTAGGYAIANVIQTNTAINPGNSGGLLLNALGNVVGITTAIVSDSQGLGFAIPSLINDGTYKGHSYLGVTGTDMSYAVAQETGDTVTYGWKLASVARNGPSNDKLQVGDIIIAMNSVTIKSNDDLASYLEEHTLPGDTITLTVVRNNVETLVDVTLGIRPAPT
jgi:S1-C subfamily serine protease